MFGRKRKSCYIPVYEVWEIRKGVFENNERYCGYFYTHKAARRWIEAERRRLWEMGGMRLALGTTYDIRLGKEYK